MSDLRSVAPFPAWNDAHAATLDEPGCLLYRSQLLGSDARMTHPGGGQASDKILQADPLGGADVPVLWIKGLNDDLGAVTPDGFATLSLDRLQALRALYRGPAHEDEMMGYLPHCTFNLNPFTVGVDAFLHACVPFAHVDHTHPDAVIAIASMVDGERVTRQVFEGELGWLPWLCPGYELGLRLADHVARHPGQRGVVLAGHGLVTWGPDASSCYDHTVGFIAQAQAWLQREGLARQSVSFGGVRHEALPAGLQEAALAHLLPVLRGLVSHAGARAGTGPKVAHVSRQPAVMEFVNSRQLDTLAAQGTSCPDHFLRTHIRPLVLDESVYTRQGNALAEAMEARLAAYRSGYRAYYERCKHADSPPMHDPNPVIVLLPRLGLVALAPDKAMARLASELYTHAIAVMREASAIDRYVGLPEQEAFKIEYQPVEEVPMQPLTPRLLSGRVALVTGGAGGIGQAIARRLLAQGACVVLADLDADALAAVTADLAHTWGRDAVRGVRCDVTQEVSVISAFQHTTLEFGGLDIVVSNAGIASAAPIDDTSLEVWHRHQSVLATGYFLVSREAFRLMKAQGQGGAIVMIASKNGLVPGPQASAYSAAKAAEIQLSRSLALEGAPLGIRCNVVNPDAVIRGSKIWTGKWSEDQAATHRLSAHELEVFYRNRSLLKRSVFPEDVAEAAYFFATEALSGKCTGNILNVDGGHVAAFTR